MGRIAAEGMIEAGVDFETALHWHLTSNHYPPAGYMFEPCKTAIALANEGKWDDPVPGLTHGGTNPALPVSAGEVVEAFHLDFWIKEN